MKRNFYPKRKKPPGFRLHRRPKMPTRRELEWLKWADFRAKMACLAYGHRPTIGAGGESICLICGNALNKLDLALL